MNVSYRNRLNRSCSEREIQKVKDQMVQEHKAEMSAEHERHLQVMEKAMDTVTENKAKVKEHKDEDILEEEVYSSEISVSNGSIDILAELAGIQLLHWNRNCDACETASQQLELGLIRQPRRQIEVYEGNHFRTLF